MEASQSPPGIDASVANDKRSRTTKNNPITPNWSRNLKTPILCFSTKKSKHKIHHTKLNAKPELLCGGVGRILAFDSGKKQLTFRTRSLMHQPQLTRVLGSLLIKEKSSSLLRVSTDCCKRLHGRGLCKGRCWPTVTSNCGLSRVPPECRILASNPLGLLKISPSTRLRKQQLNYSRFFFLVLKASREGAIYGCWQRCWLFDESLVRCVEKVPAPCRLSLPWWRSKRLIDSPGNSIGLPSSGCEPGTVSSSTG